jgi:response regulator of citrate/malate metabolism
MTKFTNSYKLILLDLADTKCGSLILCRWRRSLVSLECVLISAVYKKTTHKDKYHMPIVDMLINNISRNRVISFLDGNAGYNQIFQPSLVYLNGLL